MLRQCAWCLRLIDQMGQRLSTQPLPKLYEASHGMCEVCGTLWIEQVLSQASSFYLEENGQEIESVSRDSFPLPYMTDFSILRQEGNAVPIVCESNSEYSFSNGLASGAMDDTPEPDLASRE